MSGGVIRIAVVRDLTGKATCVGPNDYMSSDYSDQMEAAICYHIGGGFTPADKRWVTVTLPEVSATIPSHEGAVDE